MSLVHRIAALSAALALSASAAQASISYLFTIDTSSIAGTAGYIDLQLGNSGGPAVFQTAFAKVTDFQTDGTLGAEDPYSTSTGGVDDVLGDVHGLLPGNLVFTDTGAFAVNDYFQSFTFGSSLSFRVTLFGPAIDAPACVPVGNCAAHVFAVDLLDSGLTPLLNDPSDIQSAGFLLARIDVDSAGQASVLNFSPNLTLTAVPEPASWALMLAGFGAMGVALRRRRLVAV